VTVDERRSLIGRYSPLLMLITEYTDGEVSAVEEGVAAGATAVVLRRRMSLGEASIHLRGLRGLTEGRALLLLHSSSNYGPQLTATIVPVTRCDGVHVPEYAPEGYSVPPKVQAIRQLVGHQSVLSKSVHSVAAAVDAERDGADMLVLGTVFPSKSHPGGPTIGLEGVREVCAAVKIPVIGIGGITTKNAGDVIRAGASGVAVISAIFDAPDPRAAAAELRAEIDQAWAERTDN
jgi:thiamine monophosphate synthase